MTDPGFEPHTHHFRVRHPNHEVRMWVAKDWRTWKQGNSGSRSREPRREDINNEALQPPDRIKSKRRTPAPYVVMQRRALDVPWRCVRQSGGGGHEHELVMGIGMRGAGG
jgi:hypothetical protein